ncbi:exonuclease domain-containing protein [Streptomyces sp. NPDC001142]
MSWHTGRLAGFDLETSGVNVEADRIVTACIVGCGGGDPVVSTTWLADPGIDIPAEATAVHGISTEKARTDGRPAAEVVEEIVHALAEAVTDGTPIIVMNAPYDLTLLDREARRYGITPLTELVGNELRVIDPRVMDKAVDQLHAVQQQWAAQQAASYAGYLARTPGREHEAATVRPEWPLVPHQSRRTA